MLGQNHHATHVRDMWNSKYESLDYVYGIDPNKWLSKYKNDFLSNKSRTALSVADGEGRNSVWLSSTGLTVDAFDISENAVRKAQALAEKKGQSVNFQVASDSSFQWREGHYDFIVAIFIQFAEPETRSEIFRKIKNSLKPNGKLYLLGYGVDQLRYRTGGPGRLDHLYTRELLQESFADLHIEELSEFEEVLNEGDGHSGRSSLIGLIAQKK